jgi:hypothetical protein
MYYIWDFTEKEAKPLRNVLVEIIRRAVVLEL